MREHRPPALVAKEDGRVRSSPRLGERESPRLESTTAMKAPVLGILGLLAWLAPGAFLGQVRGPDDRPGHPHPVVAWPMNPFEVRVAFDRPLDESVVPSAVGRLIPFQEEESV